MTYANWIIYVLAVLVLTASPGPSVLLCVSKSVSYGFRVAFATALGSLLAIVLIMTASFSGLGVIIAKSDIAFSIIKWGGAAYLIYLGIQAFRSNQESYQIAKPGLSRRGLLSHAASGFIVGASNPKAIVFFTALFPQFIDTQSVLLPQYLVLAVTFAVLELFWLSFYAAIAVRSSGWLSAPGRAKRFNQLTGGVFIGAGVLLSTTTRASAN
jgi:threonine/homoserine/homoserine lactone efflux protein